jgi:hypothetical protein
MKIAKITHDSPVQGFVMDANDMMVAIQCQRVDGEWHPLFGIKRGVGKLELPSCFMLDDTCAAALELAYEDYKEGDDGE